MGSPLDRARCTKETSVLSFGPTSIRPWKVADLEWWLLGHMTVLRLTTAHRPSRNYKHDVERLHYSHLHSISELCLTTCHIRRDGLLRDILQTIILGGEISFSFQCVDHSGIRVAALQMITNPKSAESPNRCLLKFGVSVLDYHTLAITAQVNSASL